MKKTLLLATFVNKNKLKTVIKLICDKFSLSQDDLFFFSVTNTDDLLITYRVINDSDKKIDIKKDLKKTIIIHKKGSTIYTINALNKLIQLENIDKVGNIDFKTIKLDWDKYKDNVILINNDELKFLPITRIFIES